jgi:protein-L-isoaspartate(D-aspartate) O-methyltransferase
MDKADRFTLARLRMVEEQLAARDVTDQRVLEAMRLVPRHLFVPPDLAEEAYLDTPLPIGCRQTISQPYIVALMTELLALHGKETVLEIGTGSGYQAAILAHLCRQVFTVERIPELGQAARRILEELGYHNVTVVEGDGSQGLPDHAPYHAIVVTAAAPEVPEPLKLQLAGGGRLVLPVGRHHGQILERWIRRGDDFKRERLAPVAFVPLVGEYGWTSDERAPFWWF